MKIPAFHTLENVIRHTESSFEQCVGYKHCSPARDRLLLLCSHSRPSCSDPTRNVWAGHSPLAFRRS